MYSTARDLHVHCKGFTCTKYCKGFTCTVLQGIYMYSMRKGFTCTVLQGIYMYSTARDLRVLSTARDLRVLSTARDLRVLSTARDLRVLSTARDLHVLCIIAFLLLHTAPLAYSARLFNYFELTCTSPQKGASSATGSVAVEQSEPMMRSLPVGSNI